jgi:hypothetical protein
MFYRIAFLCILIFFNTLVTIFSQAVPVLVDWGSNTLAVIADDKESDLVGTDLDGMKSLFNTTLSE